MWRTSVVWGRLRLPPDGCGKPLLLPSTRPPQSPASIPKDAVFPDIHTLYDYYERFSLNGIHRYRCRHEHARGLRKGRAGREAPGCRPGGLEQDDGPDSGRHHASGERWRAPSERDRYGDLHPGLARGAGGGRGRGRGTRTPARRHRSSAPGRGGYVRASRRRGPCATDVRIGVVFAQHVRARGLSASPGDRAGERVLSGARRRFSTRLDASADPLRATSRGRCSRGSSCASRERSS